MTPKRILIIEDDPHIATALAARFRARDYATCIAGDAVVGFSQAIRQRPDLILLDINLPGGDGLSLAQRLKSVNQTRRIPFILVTARRDDSLRAQAMALNAAGLFEKPYDAEELLAVAGHVLGDTGMFRRPVPPRPDDEALGMMARPPVKRVLVVEDDAEIAAALEVRLKAAGYAVTLAADAAGGLSAAVRSRPDLVLLDITLPAGDGFTLAERIRQVLPDPTPVIFITASREAASRRRAEALGAAAFLEKPYEPAELLEAVHRAVSR